MGPRAGAVVNLLAVGYGTLMALNLLWPRAQVYGGGAYRWGGLLSVLGVVVIGAAYYLRALRGKDARIAAAHRYEVPARASDNLARSTFPSLVASTAATPTNGRHRAIADPGNTRALPLPLVTPKHRSPES
jgi:hypothetical protein